MFKSLALILSPLLISIDVEPEYGSLNEVEKLLDVLVILAEDIGAEEIWLDLDELVVSEWLW